MPVAKVGLGRRNGAGALVGREWTRSLWHQRPVRERVEMDVADLQEQTLLGW